MAITTVTATTPAESAKSIQLAFNEVYASQTVKLEYSTTSGGTFSDVTKDYDISIVKDSSKADVTATPEYYYSLVIGKFDYYEAGGHIAEVQAKIDQMLAPGYYKITIEGVTSSEINVENTLTSAAALDSTIPVTAVGSSILQLRFTAPIRNLFVTHFSSSLNATILDNISYSYGVADPETPFIVNPNNFKGYLSNDGKVLTLESPDLNFENGKNVTAYINDSTFQQFPRSNSTVLTNYDKTLSTIPVDSDDDATAVSVENTAAIINTAAGTRTKLNATFTKPVLLPSVADLSNNNILSINGTTPRSISLSSVTRNGYDFVTGDNAAIKADYAKLVLNIVPTGTNSLPADNSVSLNVGALSPNINGALIDASRLLIPKTTVTAAITAETPKIISVAQNITSSTKDTTEIDVTFSQSMNISPVTGVTSALDASNYTLRIDATNQTGPASVEVIPNFNNTKFKLIYDSIITSTAAQTVTLTVANTVTNAMGDAFANTGVDNVATLTQLKDTTIPEVTSIIALNKSPDNTGNTVTDKDNGLIIKYKAAMATTGANSATLSTNYKFIESTVPVTDVPLDATATAVTGTSTANSWILFTLDPADNYPVFQDTSAATSGSPNTNYDIRIGYPGLTSADYKYVENSAGNIYPICNTKKIDATVPLIDLSKGTVTIYDDHTLVYKYTDQSVVNNIVYHNEFSENTINTTNFVLYELDEFNCQGTKKPLTITNADLDDTGTSITFEVTAGSLSSKTKYIYLSPANQTTPAVLDIFNKEVSGVFCNEVINSIPTSLINLNLIDIVKKVSVDPNNPNLIGYPVEIAARFTNPIAVTSPRDFLISFAETTTPTSYQNVPISSTEILQVNGENSNTIILKAYVPTIGIDNLDNALYLRTSVNDFYYLRTKDTNKKFIDKFSYTKIDSFNIGMSMWRFQDSPVLDSAELIVSYNDEIDFTSIPAEIATTSGLTINNVKFAPQIIDNNYYYIASLNTDLGYFVLNVKSHTDTLFTSARSDIAFNVNISKSPDSITNSGLIFKFSKANATDNLALNIDNVVFIEYISPKYKIMGIDANNNNKLYANVSFEGNSNTPIV